MEIENKQEFKKLLNEGIVEFKYTKVNGEERTAKGTTKIDIMGEENAPQNKDYKYTDDIIRYYDLNSEGWRSFKFENLIEYNKGE